MLELKLIVLLKMTQVLQYYIADLQKYRKKL